MPCLLILLALVFPRVALVLMWLVGYSQPAFQTALWPLLGFIFMPFTTCAWAVGMNENGAITGWALILVILGAVLDLGGHGGGYSYRTRTVVVRE